MPAEDIPSGPTVVHRVKSKLGYTEMHANAPGFSEDVSRLTHENNTACYHQSKNK